MGNSADKLRRESASYSAAE